MDPNLNISADGEEEDWNPEDCRPKTYGPEEGFTFEGIFHPFSQYSPDIWSQYLKEGKAIYPYIPIMVKRYHYSLDNLPPLLYMDEDTACLCLVPSDSQGRLPIQNEKQDCISMVADGGQSNHSNNLPAKRPPDNKNKPVSDFYVSVSSNMTKKREASPSDSTIRKRIIPYLSEPQSCSSQFRKKKTQECTRCANHDISVPMKGHKHYCPYISCSCELCEVTQMKNYYSKMYQKLNRNRQGHGKVPQTDATKFTPDITYREFPESRRQELLQDLNETGLNFLKDIKGLCIPGNKW